MTEKYGLKMNKDVARKWVNALRSGDYTQAFTALRRKTAQYRQLTFGDTKETNRYSYCALGVLNHLYQDEIAKITPKEFVWTGRAGLSPYLRQIIAQVEAEMPNQIVNEAKLYYAESNSDIVVIDRKDKYTTVMTMNDGRRESFYEIADAIERTYLADE